MASRPSAAEFNPPDDRTLRRPSSVYDDSPATNTTDYRNNPTPHPNKSDECFAPQEPQPRDRQPSVQRPRKSIVGEKLNVPDNVIRPAFPSWSSSFETALPSAGLQERTLSNVESGQERPRRTSGVVASLIQYGLARATGNVPISESGSALSRSTSFASTYGDAERASVGRKQSYRDKCLLRRGRRQAEIVRNVESYIKRQKFILKLAKALLSFGAPSHRIESQLVSASEILKVNAAFVHFPNMIIVSFLDSDTRTSETHFVRAGGRVALTALHKVHLVYRDVLHDDISASEGTEQLKKILQAKPLYSIYVRCIFAFICASIICTLSFGGSVVDMFISGASASLLQYLGLNAAAKSSIYANVYEISVSIVVSFLARVLGTLPGNIFCYSAISSAGVVLILPGFTILISALELTSRNIMCGSVRMVYAIIYTLFLGFGLTIGSDFYLVIDRDARRNLAASSMLGAETYHGHIIANNDSLAIPSLGGTFSFTDVAQAASHTFKGCYRDPSWPWYRQPFPWWTMLFLVPIYSICSSLSNLQTIRSVQLPVMVVFSCAAYAANKGANYLISQRSDIVSAFGALIIGLCGNLYSRVVGGTAFTSMVTGVLFLVPSAIGNGGGLIQDYNSSSAQYSNSFDLGIRMIEVAIGVTIGLFVAQIMVYTLGRRKNAAHFAF